MQINSKDFVYETPEQFKRRKQAIEYYERCMRIREARKIKKDGYAIGTPKTIEFSKIEQAVVSLQRKFRASHRSDTKE
jgi:hypothetical protein